LSLSAHISNPTAPWGWYSPLWEPVHYTIRLNIELLVYLISFHEIFRGSAPRTLICSTRRR
jgi:hypothetical protein